MNSTSHYFPLDALPDNIRSIYEEAERSVNEWVTSLETEQAQNIAEFFEAELALLNPEQRLRFLCSLVKSWPYTEYPWAASLLDEQDSEEQYMAWLTLRFMQAICLYIGPSRLRTARAVLREEWDALPAQLRPALYFSYSTVTVSELLQFCFAVLIPFARASVARRDSRPTREAGVVMQESLRNLRPEPTATRQPISSSRAASPKKLDNLCASGFTVAELKELLATLDVIDPDTGKWHLGNLTSKAASPKSAFPAAYRALEEAKLMLATSAATYSKLFEVAFGIKLSERTAAYTERNGSTAFLDYLAEARRWIRSRNIRRETE